MQLNVSIVSHIYLEKRYRAKLNSLASRINLTVVSPKQFPFAYGDYTGDFSQAPYAVRLHRCLYPLLIQTSTRWILSSPDWGMRRTKPHVIHIENEAHSFVVLQGLIYRRLFAREARIIVSVWANQELIGLKGKLLNLLEAIMRPHIDFFVSGNKEGREILLRKGVPSEKIAVVPHVGVDQGHYRPPSLVEREQSRIKLSINAEDFVVGFVGRLVPEKGIDHLVRAFERCSSQSIRPFKLLLVGSGPMKSGLQQYPNTMVVSPGGAGAVLPYYWAMDVLILPSRTMPRWKEQFGIVLIEAMASGVPVVGSDSGAIPEVIGQAGLIFKEGDVEELIRILDGLSKDEAKRLGLARLGKQRILEMFSEDRISERILDVYDKAISHCPSEPVKSTTRA